MTFETEDPEFVNTARELLTNADKTAGLEFIVVWTQVYDENWRILFRVVGNQSARYLVESVDGKTEILSIDDAPIPEPKTSSEGN